jgi:hypothetical protein
MAGRAVFLALSSLFWAFFFFFLVALVRPSIVGLFPFFFSLAVYSSRSFTGISAACSNRLATDVEIPTPAKAAFFNFFPCAGRGLSASLDQRFLSPVQFP